MAPEKDRNIRVRVVDDIKIMKEPFWDCTPKSRKGYHWFIRLILNYADAVCFTVRPFFDGIDELNGSIWSDMQYSVLDYGFAGAASDFAGYKSHLVIFRADYSAYEFFQGRKGIFDFCEEDAGSGITLEDPASMKDGEVFCYTVTHEKICIVTESIYKQLHDRKKEVDTSVPVDSLSRSRN